MNESLILVIFGITGDLAQRKLLPAIYNLRKNSELKCDLTIVGISRRPITSHQVYEKLEDFVGKNNFHDQIKSELISFTKIVQMELDDKDAYTSLLGLLREIELTNNKSSTRLYYLSIPSEAFESVIDNLGATGHNKSIDNLVDEPRILIEKPFGHDLDSAKRLIKLVDKNFSEDQVYRIDHYLAKETVQNILTFRFENPLFEDVWDNRYVSEISIKAHEKIGIEGRANFYEHTGALRDLVQSHLLQLLAITTISKPEQMDSKSIHEQKLKILNSIVPIPLNQVENLTKRGQYRGYKEEVNNPESFVETFARIRLSIDNNQWAGVPIILETGKALATKNTEITVCFRRKKENQYNRLVFRIQPDEGISLLLHVKRPGVDNYVDVANMNFSYNSEFEQRQAEAYERVLVDAIKGDQTLFATSDEVIATWEIVENILIKWQENGQGLIFYDSDTEL
jgi:glucose-6-phosphate 1-dehydrogenase